MQYIIAIILGFLSPIAELLFLSWLYPDKTSPQRERAKDFFILAIAIVVVMFALVTIVSLVFYVR